MSETARVKSTTDSSKLAGYLAHMFESGKSDQTLDAIGPAAVNAVVKAVAIAKGLLAPKGISIAIDPAYFDVQLDNDQEESRTGIKLTVFRLKGVHRD